MREFCTLDDWAKNISEFEILILQLSGLRVFFPIEISCVIQRGQRYECSHAGVYMLLLMFNPWELNVTLSSGDCTPQLSICVPKTVGSADGSLCILNLPLPAF